MWFYLEVAYHLQLLLQHTHWKRDKLHRYQDQKLREIVHYAYEYVPFYHEKFKLSGMRPEQIKSAADLRKLWIVGKKELQRNDKKLISTGIRLSSLKKVSTTGSTGRPFSTYVTEEEDAFRKAKFLRAYIACGLRPRDIWAVIAAPIHEAVTGRVQRILGIFNPIPVSVFYDSTKQIAAIQRIAPDVLDGYSSSLTLLAREVEKRDIGDINPRIIIGGAELIDNFDRRLVERVFKAPFYDQYACTELDRLSWQCGNRGEYHIDSDSVILQLVDKNGDDVAAGESGEIVCTSLFNHAMPFIRYAVGDRGRASDEDTCPCGRTFPLMKMVEGRKDSTVVLLGGRMLSPLAIGDCMTFFKYIQSIGQYRVIQKKIDYFKFLVSKTNDGIEDSFLRAELLAHLRKTLNMPESEVTIDVEFVDEIPVDSTGKLSKVVSEVKS